MHSVKWKPIKGYEGSYEISENGEVKSCSRVLKNGSKGNHLSKEIFLKQKVQNGYYTVTLYKNNKAKHHYVHRLVAAAFIENSLNKEFVNHKNGKKLINNVENLNWANQKENTDHAVKTGLISKFYISRDQLNNLYVAEKKSITCIAKLCGVSPSTISNRLELYGIRKRSLSEQSKLREY